MAKIILVSSGQPSLNPRLVKEADALTQAGYDVTVLYAYWNEWGTEYDDQLFTSRKWKAERIGGSPFKGRFTYLISKVLYRLVRSIPLSPIAFIALSRPSLHLTLKVKKHKADLYIAHNLGALPAACIAAKKHGKPCGFDAEDFHRNETSDDTNDRDVILKTRIENKYLPRLNYITASSPQIAEKYKTLFPVLDPVVILNVFYRSNAEVTRPSNPVKLFWFSQTIGPGRGIEDIVKALSILSKEHFELHLLGEVTAFNQVFIINLKNTGINIKIHAPIAPDEIIPFAAQFDIGLALEKTTPLNRDLCLTNKIFSYMQAGLAIVATDTKAQAALVQQHPEIGFTFKNGDVNALAALLANYQQYPEKLFDCKKAAFNLGHSTYNWETESKKFLNLVAQTL